MTRRTITATLGLVGMVVGVLGVLGCATREISPFERAMMRVEQERARAVAPAREATIDIIPPRVQALEAIEGTDPRFTVGALEDREVWTRARTFLTQFTEGGIGGEVARGDSLAITNRPRDPTTGKDAYLYVIEKRFHKGGVDYRVICTPRGSGATPMLAERNARNVARFLREGNLELSLLAR